MKLHPSVLAILLGATLVLSLMTIDAVEASEVSITEASQRDVNELYAYTAGIFVCLNKEESAGQPKKARVFFAELQSQMAFFEFTPEEGSIIEGMARAMAPNIYQDDTCDQVLIGLID